MSYQGFDPHNPYSQAYGFGYGPNRPDPSNMVKGPAVGLIVTSSFWLLLLVLSLVLNLFKLVVGAKFDLQQANGPLGDAAIPVQLVGIMLLSGVNACTLYGGLSMLQKRNYGVAMTAAVLSIIPCLSPCYIVGIPFGIWAMVLMLRPDVRYGFR